jgi:hypothetical protein
MALASARLNHKVIFQATSGKSWRKLELGKARIMANQISLFLVPLMIACLSTIY